MPDADKLCRIEDRRVGANDSWSYKWRARDGSMSHWVTEDEMLETLKVLPWTLDTFHALYELRHEGRVPQHAQRPAPRADAAMRKAEALERYPIGTSVVRKTRNDDDAYMYVRGAVRNF